MIKIEARNDALVRLDGGLRLEPVENVDCLKGTFFRQAVGGGVAFGGFNRLGALVEQMDVRRAGAGGVQAESAEKAEAIQHLCAFANCDTA